MRKKIILTFLFVFILSLLSPALGEGKTGVLVDGMSVKELKGIRFTILFREVRKEDEGPLGIDGKLLTTGSSSLLDRIDNANSQFDIVVTNLIYEKQEEAAELTFKNCEIKSVSKSPEQWVYLFEAEKIE